MLKLFRKTSWPRFPTNPPLLSKCQVWQTKHCPLLHTQYFSGANLNSFSADSQTIGNTDAVRNNNPTFHLALSWSHRYLSAHKDITFYCHSISSLLFPSPYPQTLLQRCLAWQLVSIDGSLGLPSNTHCNFLIGLYEDPRRLFEN